MNVFSFASAVAFTMYALLGLSVVRRPSRRSPARWAFALYCTLYAAWSAMYAFMSSVGDEASAWALIRSFSFSWTLSASAFLHFALLLTNRIKPRNWIAQLLIYVPGLVFAVKGAAGPLFFDTLIRTGGVWYEVATARSVWPLLYTIYYYAAIIGGLVVIWLRARGSDRHVDRAQAMIITIGYVATGLLVGFANFVAPAVGLALPRIAHLLMLLWSVSIWYAITQYDFLEEITVATVRHPLWALFTRREHEIIGLLVRGHSYRDIAERLFISYHTVKSHVERIYAKAEVRNKAQLLYKLHADDQPSGPPATASRGA